MLKRHVLGVRVQKLLLCMCVGNVPPSLTQPSSRQTNLLNITIGHTEKGDKSLVLGSKERQKAPEM